MITYFYPQFKKKKFFEATVNTKTNYSFSSKKNNDIRPNTIFEDLKFEN